MHSAAGLRFIIGGYNRYDSRKRTNIVRDGAGQIDQQIDFLTNRRCYADRHRPLDDLVPGIGDTGTG